MKPKKKQSFKRHSRKGALSARKRLHHCHAVVIGAGAMGRAVAILLASLGVRQMSLYDPTCVSKKDLALGFMDFDIGSAKVDAVANIAHQQNPHMELLTYRSRFLLTHLQECRPGLKNAVFLCGGTLAASKSTPNKVNQSTHFFCEARLGSNEIRLLSSTKPNEASEIELVTTKPGRSSNDLVMANLSACLMAFQFVRWLKDRPVRNDQLYHLNCTRFSSI